MADWLCLSVPTVLLLTVWVGVAITERFATPSVVVADVPTPATFLVLEIITAAVCVIILLIHHFVRSLTRVSF